MADRLYSMILVKDFSLSEPFSYKITAKLNSQQGALRVTGPAEVDGSAAG